MNDIRPIETCWDGFRFRSRLEARWAVFFKSLGVRYEYEPEGFVVRGRPYLPDFLLPNLNVWAEIKPSGAGGDSRISDMWQIDGRDSLLIAGSPRRGDYKVTIYTPMAARDGGEFCLDNLGELWVRHDWRVRSECSGDEQRKVYEIRENSPRLVSALRAATQARFEHGEQPAIPERPPEFKAGDRARHPYFGDGIVTRYDGSGGDAQISVMFPGHGPKKLIAGYARLVKI